MKLFSFNLSKPFQFLNMRNFQPEGLPGIWMEPGFCDRCKPFNECLGLRNMEDKEWASAEDLITQATNLLEIKEPPNLNVAERNCKIDK